MTMQRSSLSRRQLLTGPALGLSAFLLSQKLMLLPAQAQSAGALAATQTMRGGDNNYRPNAPMVTDLGTGFVVSGVVLRADTGAPASQVRLQIWAATGRGGEREPSNHGSILTDAQGNYRLDISPIVPHFGEPHIHMAYDDGAFETLFLRPVLESVAQTTMGIDIVLAPRPA